MKIEYALIWLGLLLMYLFALKLGWLPSFGYGDGGGGPTPQMIEQLDANPAKKQKVFVYSLENADVRDVEQVLIRTLSDYGVQAGRIKDERYRRLFEDSRSRIQAMAMVHEKLYHSGDMARVDFSLYASELAAHLAGRRHEALVVGHVAGRLTVEHDRERIRAAGFGGNQPAGRIHRHPGRVVVRDIDGHSEPGAVGRQLRSLVAIFAGDDDSAIGAMRAIKMRGRLIPQDVAVVGFDDVPFARYLSPALTTVRAPIEEIGREAVRQLTRLMNGEQAQTLTLMRTELVIRESCGCGLVVIESEAPLRP